MPGLTGTSAALLCLGVPVAVGELPPYTTKLGDKLWKKANKQVKKLGKSNYESNTNWVCGVGTWGDGPQCNQWDQGRSPCWPSAMTVSATWDLEVMELWTKEMAQEFGGPGRGQLGPGVNVLRFPWNGRAGEYMAGEDPYFAAHMVTTMTKAARKVKNPPLQVVKHFVPNTIEKHRNEIVEEVDERTLFEVYYPPFEASVEAGVAAFMCSYNLVKCTTGRCGNEGVYACASSDVLNEHLKGIMGFKGMVISDWDATKCQDAAADSPGCTAGGYIDNDFAAEGGLDLEMPSCMSFSGGVTKRAKEKAARMQWSYLVQNQESPGASGHSWRRLSKKKDTAGKTLKWVAKEGKCFQVSWDGDDSDDEGLQLFMSDCKGGDRQLFHWDADDKRLHWVGEPELCLGVPENHLKAKASLRVLKCSSDAKGQEFVIPKNKGQMVSTSDTGLCVKASWAGAALAECDDDDEDQEVEWGIHVRNAKDKSVQRVHHSNVKGAFIMTEAGRCLQAGAQGGYPYNSLKLVFAECDEDEESQQWLWYQGNSTIRAAAHPSMCVDVTDSKFEDGTPLQIWECMEGNRNQVFQMFDNSSTGHVRTLQHSNVCARPEEPSAIPAVPVVPVAPTGDDDGDDDDLANLPATLAACADKQTLFGVSHDSNGKTEKEEWKAFVAPNAPVGFAKSWEKLGNEETSSTGGWTPPAVPAAPAAPGGWTPPAVPAAPGAPAAPASAPAPEPDWHSGVYDWKSDNPFGKSEADNADNAPSDKEIAAAKEAMSDGPTLNASCPDAAGDNFKSKCKLSLADRIIAEATVLLKNKGGVLPLTGETKVALVGKEACSHSPLAQGGGSGWNGFACNQVPKVNVEDGIKGLKNGASVSCPDNGDDNAAAEKADVIVIVVAPEKAEEGRDRSTMQVHDKDKKLIQKYSALKKKVVVVINNPGPMMLNTWDEDVDAIMMTWLPGVQNGRGIAMALFNDTYGASGRLPFTFPKCKTKECSEDDEFSSAPLGDQIKSGEYVKYKEKALIGYRWYQANDIEVGYPFGFGLFAYGSAKVTYGDVAAAADGDLVKVTSSVSHDGSSAGKDVPQLYIQFPDSVPGDAEAKPKWVLKGFTKVNLQPGMATKVSFRLTRRDLSYWDDTTKQSHWVCAAGTFKACVGANANDAVANEDSCTTFENVCPTEQTKSSALPLEAIIEKVELRAPSFAKVAALTVPSASIFSKVSPTVSAGAAALLLTLVVARFGARSRSTGYGELAEQASPLAADVDAI